VVLISFAGHLGASLSGILDAIPLTSLMMRSSPDANQDAHGSSASYAVSPADRSPTSWRCFVLVEMWKAHNEFAAFGVSLVAALLVQLAVQSSGSIAVSGAS